MGEFSLVHILVVLLVATVLFGPQKIARLGKDLGKGVRSFKTGISGDEPPPRKKKRKKRRELAAAPPRAELGDGDAVEPTEQA